MDTSTRPDTRPHSPRASAPPERAGDDPEDLYKLLFGRPVLPLDAFAFGRSVGRRLKRLFPDQLTHALRGVRAGINELRERGEVRQ
jgi:hypothetical protein